MQSNKTVKKDIYKSSALKGKNLDSLQQVEAKKKKEKVLLSIGVKRQVKCPLI